MEEHKSHLFGLALVAVIGMGALVMMFSQANTTGQATKINSVLTPMTQCNSGELLVSPNTVQALGSLGKQVYGNDFSAYSDAGCYFLPRTGYCCQESYLREVLG